MMLDSRQVSLLTEMGIPVWELRASNEIEITTEAIEQPVVDIAALLDRVAQSNWLICCEDVLTQAAHRLLQAMLSTIGLSLADVCLLSLTELSKLIETAEGEFQQKVVLLLGEQAVKQAFDESARVSNYRNETHAISPSKLATVVSFSLENLLQSPENKVLAWQDLQLAKNSQQQQL
jgi:hypothetical protein